MKNAQCILALVTVNEKGQIVIPADARTAIDLHAGDKLLVMVHPSNEGVILVKPDGLETFAKRMLEQVNDARRDIAAQDNEGNKPEPK
jgi:AbrB family looped-hinge helix DNA binding protein